MGRAAAASLPPQHGATRHCMALYLHQACHVCTVPIAPLEYVTRRRNRGYSSQHSARAVPLPTLQPRRSVQPRTFPLLWRGLRGGVGPPCPPSHHKSYTLCPYLISEYFVDLPHSRIPENSSRRPSTGPRRQKVLTHSNRARVSCTSNTWWHVQTAGAARRARARWPSPPSSTSSGRTAAPPAGRCCWCGRSAGRPTATATTPSVRQPTLPTSCCVPPF